MKGLGYLGAFLGGALVGVAAGILLAPDKGKNTRKKMADPIDEFMKKHNVKADAGEVDDLMDNLEAATEGKR